MKIGQTMKMLAFLTLFLVSNIACTSYFVASGDTTELPHTYPLVYVYPELVNETFVQEVNDTFTISVVVYNLTDAYVPDPDNSLLNVPLGNLYGFDIQFTWDPNIIKYVNHTVTVPVESYPNPIPPANYTGILHQPFFLFNEVVNETGNIPDANPETRAWFSATSLAPDAVAFNGNGTLFTMTFKVLKKGASPLKIVECVLADENGVRIAYTNGNVGQGIDPHWLNPPRSGEFRLAPKADFTYWPDIGVVNKTVYFEASVTENISNIETYMWDFGDGTKINTTTPEVQYNYTDADTYTAGLKVVDADGVESMTTEKPVNVAVYRDLKATSVTLSQYSIRPNRTLTIATVVDNVGSAPFSFDENCSLTLSYNASSVNWGNIAATSWIPVGSNQTLVKKGSYERMSFRLNSSELPTPEAYYYFLANVTGILSGYEYNTTNNMKLSEALLYTNRTIHEPAITAFKFGFELAGALKLPVIEGENTTFSIVVKNNGNERDRFNVTLYANSSSIKTWQTPQVEPFTSQTLVWSYLFSFGYHNLTVEAVAENATAARYGVLRVVRRPQLIVERSLESPLTGQEVVFNCSASTHLDPESRITVYTWRIYAPGVDPVGGSPSKTFLNMTVISYTFNVTGKWTIVLEVTDNNALKYDGRRPATSAYRKEIPLTVEQAAFPIEWIIVIVVVVIVLIAAVVLVLRRKRGPKPSE